MIQLIAGLLVLLATVSALADQPVVGARDGRPAATGWALERDVESPSYAVIEPASTNLNIDSLVLSCEQGPQRRGLQLRLYLSGSGPLAARSGASLNDDPTVDLAIDKRSHAAQLLFADDFVVVADAADGPLPLLSDSLLDALQTGRRMELRVPLARAAHARTSAFTSMAVVDLQAGPGGAAIAELRRCARGADPRFAERVGHSL
jgi:hypothetical protein